MLIKFLLNGKKIDLTSDNITIKSNNFNVDENGNMSCNSAEMNNVNINKGTIKLSDVPPDSNSYFEIESTNGDRFGASGSRMWLNRGTGGTAIYFQGGYLSQASISLYDQNGSSTRIYGSGITTPSLTQTSLESQKKNFEKLDNALEIIKKVDIYKYNLKTEKDTDKKHIGFVIGSDYKYSKELTSIENDGADIYSLSSCCLKAIQELNEIIENKNKKIEELERNRK